ncbi:hypothetical protein BT93_B2762 [Corymbia citriodora subsp. variegata]|nr:hypothetical protein BT93_B2762 [Corymbia citriodora subsp. variegata]
MEFELKEATMREAAVKGNVYSLLELLKKDELLLDKIMTGNHTETPLHIAAMLGHLNFVKEILARKAEMASVQDSQGSVPLHLAAAKGYINIVESLVRAHPDICFFRDKYKRNPLHVAAMKGHVDVLKNLVGVRLDAAYSIIDHGQTILHLCVKHNRLEALKLLIDILGNDQFINSRDEDGNTILHLAAVDRQVEAIVFLISKGVNPNITNSKGFTALTLLAQGESAGIASEIKDYVPQISENHDPSKLTIFTNNMPVDEEDKMKRKIQWQNNMHQTLLVVATLLATMAFQASITPPSGIWQEDSPSPAPSPAPSPNGILQENSQSSSLIHGAGEFVMAYKDPHSYKSFLACNTISFVASLSVIMLLISGLPLKRRRITTWIAMLTMWVAITFTAVTYTISIRVPTPRKQHRSASDTVACAMLVWVGLMVLIFLCHLVRLIFKLVRKVLKFVRKVLTKQRREDPIP